MKKDSRDKGVIFVLIERLNKQRLPRANEMKKRVDSGELLTKRDHAFLDEMLADAGKVKPLIERNPEYREIYTNACSLLKEIVDKDLENHKKA